MQLEHRFTVPVGVEHAWTVLLDIDRIAPCLPGAAIDSVDGDDFTGTVKVRLGPISLTYKGRASFTEKDASVHRAVITARGRDARGNGTADATITASLSALDEASTDVSVRTDLDITGRPAQFGRGVMVDVGNKLIGQFADCLAAQLTGPAQAQVPDPELTAAEEIDLAALPLDAADMTQAQSGGKAAPSAPSTSPATSASDAVAPVSVHDSEPIDLLSSAGPALAKRLVPTALAVAAAIYLLARRRR